MAKIVISSATGIQQLADDSGLQIDSSLTKTPLMSATALTAATTLVDGGLYTASGAGALTMVMPLASSVPGATFIFRNLSAHAHALTGSAEAAGTRVFTDGTSRGSKLALAAAVGNSVTLVSDGVNFCVMGNSGSLALTGT